MRKRKKTKNRYLTIGGREEQSLYDYHLPVMQKQAIDLLIKEPNGIYIDGTLGGGGHAAEIIGRLASGGKLLAFDLDKGAIEYCKKKFEEELQHGRESRIELYNETYRNACSIEISKANLMGLLLDLGVSSRQLDDSSKGFTYREKAELDLRFSPDGESAATLLASAKEEEIAYILRMYGEEPNAKAIARRIVEIRRAVPLFNTLQLRDIVEYCVPKRYVHNSLSRVFQALRIAVNKELEVLSDTLNCIVPKLASGGRIVVISYHSLEDRIVKNAFKNFSGKNKEHIPTLGNEANDMPLLEILTKKPIIPDDEEIARNPRARSAKMRAAEKK